MSDQAIDPQSDAARLAAHRRLHNSSLLLPPHPEHRVDLRDLERDRDARTRLVDMGWTPPKHAVDKPQVPTVAWMHPIADLVTTAPDAYTNLNAGPARELVFKNDVLDHIDWLEHGIHEWRMSALAALQQVNELRQQLQQLQADLLLARSEIDASKLSDSIDEHEAPTT